MIYKSISLYKTQMEFVCSTELHTAIKGEQKSGKTFAGLVRALTATGGYIGESQKIPVPNIGVVLSMNTTDQTAALSKFKKIAGVAIKAPNNSGQAIEMANGSRVFFVTRENIDVVRGLSLSWWFADDVENMPSLIWAILKTFPSCYSWVALNPEMNILTRNLRGYAAFEVDGDGKK